MKSSFTTVLITIMLLMTGCASAPRPREVSNPAPLPAPTPAPTPAVPASAVLPPRETTRWDFYDRIDELNSVEERSSSNSHHAETSRPKPVSLKFDRMSHSSMAVASSSTVTFSTVKNPEALARLSESNVQEGKAVLLTLVVSLTKPISELNLVVDEHQKFVKPSKSLKDKPPQFVTSTIYASKWFSYKYAKARIWNCPDFLICTPDDDARLTNDDVSVWNFTIQSKDINETKSGYLGLKIYGDNDINGSFINEITSFPPMNPSIKVIHNLTWFEKKLESSKNILELLHDNMLALGGIFTSFIAVYLYLRRRTTT